jgi:sRNA-binding carbon storage regulator CsrA
MLFLTRKPGQSITIQPQPSLRPETPVSQLFEDGPIRIQVAGVVGPQVRVGVAAHAGLCILREELRPFTPAEPAAVAENPRRALALKLKLLRFHTRHSPETLAAAAGIPLPRVLAAESGAGVLELDDLERLARVLGVKVGELFRPLGRTEQERLLLAVMEGGEGVS